MGTRCTGELFNSNENGPGATLGTEYSRCRCIECYCAWAVLICHRFGNYLAAYPDIFQYREEKSILGVNSQLKTTEDRTKAVGGMVRATSNVVDAPIFHQWACTVGSLIFGSALLTKMVNEITFFIST